MLFLNDLYSIRHSVKVLSYQKGILRTNCMDCLDRTNVFQTKISLKVFEESMAKGEFNEYFSKIMIQMW